MEKLWNYTERIKGAKKLNQALFLSFKQPKNAYKPRWTIKDVLAVLRVANVLEPQDMAKVLEGNADFAMDEEGSVLVNFYEAGERVRVLCISGLR